MPYCALDILQSLAHGRSHSHLFMDVSGFRAELWIKGGQLRRIVASQNSSLLDYLTSSQATIVLQPLHSETFLEHTKETIDLNELALLAAQHADLAVEEARAPTKILPQKKIRQSSTPKMLYSEVFFSVAIPLMIDLGDNQRITLGRNKTLCQIEVDDSRVSREHCQVTCLSPGHYEVKDLDSTNGSYLNGTKFSRCYAYSGDFLRIGDHVFVLI
jgi:FHA domain